MAKMKMSVEKITPSSRSKSKLILRTDPVKIASKGVVEQTASPTPLQTSTTSIKKLSHRRNFSLSISPTNVAIGEVDDNPLRVG